MFESLKTEADRLAADAIRLREERNAHARRGYGILKRRIGSPPGLTACFGAGVFAGARSRRPRPPKDAKVERPPERAEGGFAAFLHGPLGIAAIRLGTAFIAGALAKPDYADAGGASSESGFPV